MEGVIRIRVLLFARYAEVLGASELELELPADATVRTALGMLLARPGGNTLPHQPLVARNQVHAQFDTALAAGDELAVLPPLAGG
jgi:molybdopterin converting factor small subunit